MKITLILIITILIVQINFGQSENKNNYEIMKWNEILPELYEKIKPNGGKLKHSIDNDYQRDGLIQRIIVEFDEMSFEYNDPLYEEHNAKSNFLFKCISLSVVTKQKWNLKPYLIWKKKKLYSMNLDRKVHSQIR